MQGSVGEDFFFSVLLDVFECVAWPGTVYVGFMIDASSLQFHGLVSRRG